MQHKYNIDDTYLMISQNIKKYRLLSGMTQKDLAIKSGYSHAYIRRLESQECYKTFSIQTISNIASALNIDIKYLFSEDNI